MSGMSKTEQMLEERRNRALEGLQSGRYTVRRVQKGPVWTWEVVNETSRYMVTYDAEAKTWNCLCPDFQRHKDSLGRCKHTYMVELIEKGGRKAAPEPQAQEAQAEAQPQAPEAAAPAPAQEAAGAQAPQGAEDLVVPWGKHKGLTISQLARQDPEYLFFLARKMEARSEADGRIKNAAEAALQAAVAAAVEEAFADPQKMPTLPFGEEKGKALDRAHPKWVSILSRKGDADARSFADLVLYACARRLHEARQEARKKNASRSRSLDIEAFREAVREAVREGILAALQEAQRVIWDREGLLAELGQLRERIEAIERNGMDAVAFRFAAEEAMQLIEEQKENEMAKEERYRRLTRRPRRLVR